MPQKKKAPSAPATKKKKNEILSSSDEESLRDEPSEQELSLKKKKKTTSSGSIRSSVTRKKSNPSQDKENSLLPASQDIFEGAQSLLPESQEIFSLPKSQLKESSQQKKEPSQKVVPQKRTKDIQDTDIIDDDLSEQESDDALDNDMQPKSPLPAPSSQNKRNSIVADLEKPKVSSNRLVISHMELEDFKSYRGVQKIGPFHQCFSAIVGPNGSRKSNVIDALLFVFGFRAKALRHDTIGKLIYDQEPNLKLTQCRVSVHFKEIIDHPNGSFEDVPDSSFSVTRVGHADNSSYYQINSKKVKYNEVEKLLKSKSVDLVHNRFLILQGEVASISEMEPKASTKSKQGFLEYLEDIIGTSEYVEPIEKLAEEIENMETECASKLEKVKIADKVKSHLEGPKQEAEKFLQKEREIVENKNKLYQVELVTTTNQYEKASEQSKKLREEFLEEKNKSSEVEEQFEKITEEFNQAKEEKQSREKELTNNQSKWTKMEEKTLRLGNEVKRNKEKKKQIESTIQKEQKKIVNKKSEIEKAKEDIKVYAKSMIDLSSRKELEEKELQNVMKNIQTKTEPFQKTLKQKENEVLPHKDEANDIKTDIDRINNELELLEEPDQTSKHKLDELENSLKQLKESLPEKKKLLESKKKDLNHQEDKLKKRNSELETLTKREKEINSQISELSLKSSEAKTTTSERTGQWQIFKNIMDASKRGELKGVKGKLGDLGTIDPRYDVAVSTASPALNNIVVDTTEHAQDCVAFLKKHGLGVMTFCILEKIQYLKDAMERSFKAPNNSVRLFDLIQPDQPEYAIAFYYAMHDTLVTRDLDTASQIAYSSKPTKRVVTENGNLIEVSGAMSGGGNRTLSGFMRLSSSSSKKGKDTDKLSTKDIEKMEQEVKNLEKERLEVREKMDSLRNQIEETTILIEDLRLTIQKLLLDLSNSESQSKQLSERIPELKEKISKSVSDTQQIKKKQKDLELKMTQLKEIQGTIETIEKEVNQIKEQIMQAGGSLLKDQKQKVDKLAKEIEQKETALAESNALVLSSEKAIEKAQSAIETAQKEKISVEEAIKKAEEERKKIEEEAEEVVKTVESLETEIKEKEKNFKKLETKRSEIKKNFEKMKTRHLDLQHKIEDKEKEVNGINKKLSLKKRQIQDLPKQISKIDEDDEPINLITFDESQLEEFNVEELQVLIGRAEQEIESIKPNLNILKEYREKERDWKNKVTDLEESRKKRDDLLKESDTLKKKRFNEFMEGFTEITFKLKEMYQMITLGGDADLELVDRLDPFSEGIRFHVRPKDKSWKQISHLSGGEKTLASLSLIFALHYYKPNPLYVMDEIDAALDFKNVSIIANYIKERTQNAQFVVITLRNYMFELSDNLVGIFKPDNKSKSVTINPQHFAKPALPANNNNNNNSKTASQKAF